MTMQQMTASPTAKTKAGLAAGAGALVLIWLFEQATGRVVPGEIAIAFSTLLSFAASYIKAPGRNDHIVRADDPE